MTLNRTIVHGQRFQLGKCVITRGALAHCEDKNINYLDLLMRHAVGDFGSVGHLDNAELTRAERQHGEYATDNGLKLNALAIENQEKEEAAGMIMSIYPSPEPGDSKIWIQTLLAAEETYTTILLPEDY